MRVGAKTRRQLVDHDNPDQVGRSCRVMRGGIGAGTGIVIGTRMGVEIGEKGQFMSSHLHTLWLSFACARALHVTVGICVHICMPNGSHLMAILFTFPSIWVHILTLNGSHFTLYAHKC